MPNLKNHPDMFLNAEAGASLERFETDHGVQPLSDAGRLKSTQQTYIDRWDAGGVYNRPPYLYEPKRPAELSDHVVDGGRAIDTPNWKYWRANAGPYGWVVDYDWDVVHFRYDARKDVMKNRGASSDVTPIEDESEDIDMFILVLGKSWFMCLPKPGGGYHAIAQPGDADQHNRTANARIPVKDFTNADAGGMRELRKVVSGI